MSPLWILRDLKKEDIPQLARIEKLSYPDPWQPRYFQFLVGMENPAWGVWDGERLAGFIIAIWEQEWGENDLHIVNLAVDPDYRRRGVARFLLEQMLAYARQIRVARVYLEVRMNNQPAIDLYQKCGFMITRRLEKYYPRGLDGWEMAKPIDNSIYGERYEQC